MTRGLKPMPAGRSKESDIGCYRHLFFQGRIGPAWSAPPSRITASRRTFGEGGMGLPVRDVSRTFDLTNEQPRLLSYVIARQRSRLKGSA